MALASEYHYSCVIIIAAQQGKQIMDAKLGQNNNLDTWRWFAVWRRGSVTGKREQIKDLLKSLEILCSGIVYQICSSCNL